MAITAPRRVLAVAALVTIAAGVFGIPVAKTLCTCGFEDPTSESAAAAQLLTDKFDAGDVQLVIVVSALGGYGSGPSRTVAPGSSTSSRVLRTSPGRVGSSPPPRS